MWYSFLTLRRIQRKWTYSNRKSFLILLLNPQNIKHWLHIFRAVHLGFFLFFGFVFLCFCLFFEWYILRHCFHFIVSDKMLKCQTLPSRIFFCQEIETSQFFWVLIIQYKRVLPSVPLPKDFNLSIALHCSKDRSSLFCKHCKERMFSGDLGFICFPSF